MYMSAYSAKLFSEDDRIVVSENYLEEASGEDFCFVEKEPLKAFENEIKKSLSGTVYIQQISIWILIRKR